MASERRFLVPVFLWLIGGAISLGTFIVWANRPELLSENLGIWIGGVSCLVSLGALTEIIRRAINPQLLFAKIIIYTLGWMATIAIALFYALFFSVFWARDF